MASPPRCWKTTEHTFLLYCTLNKQVYLENDALFFLCADKEPASEAPVLTLPSACILCFTTKQQCDCCLKSSLHLMQLHAVCTHKLCVLCVYFSSRLVTVGILHMKSGGNLLQLPSTHMGNRTTCRLHLKGPRGFEHATFLM